MPAPTYSPYLQFNPDFAWGGRRWGMNDRDAFMKLLRKRGVNYNQWARRHPNAAKVFDPVEQQMYGLVQPQLDAINYERQKAEAANRRRMGDLAGFTQAIMGMLGEISPAVRGAYGEGAETMSAGGTGYGDVLNQNMAANAAKGNSLLEVLGSGQRIEGGDAGSVLAGVAGWLPSEMMKTQGEAYGKMFAEMPKEASFQAQLQMKKLLAEAAETDEDFSSEIMGILKGLPSTRADIQAQRQEMNLAKQKMRLDALDDEFNRLMKARAMALAEKKFGLAKQIEKRMEATQRRYDYESQGRDYMGNLRPEYAEAPDGTVYPRKDFHVDKNGNIVQNKSGSGGFTANQRAEMIEKIEGKEMRDNIKAEIAKEVSSGVWTPASGDQKGRQALGRRIFEKYKHLAATPSAKKRLRRVIAQVLAEATKLGPPAPGTTAGTPWDQLFVPAAAK